MTKSKVLIIETGGTFCQEKGKDGAYRPSERPYLDRVQEIHELADVVIEQVSNIDSTNMQTSYRVTLAQLIFKYHREYDGFIVIHGTDTKSDSASAVNYMLQNLGKPIVITGSQKSIFEAGNDAINNLYYAVKVATLDLGEIVIAFGDKIVRGVRAIKISEHGLNAFDSPRVEPVGEIGIDIMLKDHRIPRYKGDPILFTDFDTNIEIYHQSSGTSTRIFERYVEDDSIHGIVIVAYGAGNIQDRLIPFIERATESGKPILVITNCQLGAADMGAYAVGLAPLKAGAISAGDMTLEAAVQKLMYAVGRANKEGYKGGERLDLIKDLIHTEVGRDITVIKSRF